MLENMVLIEGTITTISPVHIGGGRMKGTFHPTLDYLPGRTLRGLIGYFLFKNQEWLTDPSSGKSLFEATGIGEQQDLKKSHILFRNAYPERDPVRFGHTVYAPLSLHWCKRCDHLVPILGGTCQNTVKGMPCGHEGKKRGGFISQKITFKTGIFSSESAGITKSVITKCPIIRRTHTSPGKEDRITPYHIESINENQRFGFRMIVGEEFLNPIMDVLEKAPVYSGIGGFRSRGYGTVRFHIDNPPKQIADVIESQASNITQDTSGDTSGCVTLVANAQMILRKNFPGKGPVSVVGFDEEFLKNANDCLELIGKYTGKKYSPLDYAENKSVALGKSIARGWSLEKGNTVDEIIPCIGAGSTVNVVADPESLAVLELFGIGEMTHCGYGQVYCLPSKVNAL